MPWGKTMTNSNLVAKMDISIDSFCITLVTEKGFQNDIKTGMEVTYRSAFTLVSTP